jgi:DNA-binding protein HU-beta
VEVMKERILEGKGVALHGFGSFDLKRREERLSVHPATGVRTIVPPKQVVAFKQGSQLKSKLKDLKYNG